MGESNVTTNDVKILELVSGDESISQRGLVEQSGLSLGMVNLILKRLAKTGYIKMVTLNKRKMRYLLTRKGLAEKSNKSYEYFLRTLNVYQNYHDRIERLINREIAQGRIQFLILGEGELSNLVHLILKSKGETVRFRVGANTLPSKNNAEVVLNCNLVSGAPVEGISILEEILHAGHPAIQRGVNNELV
jgi:predicted transcriptional regulator